MMVGGLIEESYLRELNSRITRAIAAGSLAEDSMKC